MFEELQERAFTHLAYTLMQASKLAPSGLEGPPWNCWRRDSDSEAQVNLLRYDGCSKGYQTEKRVSSLSFRCRGAAPALDSSSNQKPMKPISAKALRKKRMAPAGGIDSDWLDSPVNVFPSSFSYGQPFQSLPKLSIDHVYAAATISKQLPQTLWVTPTDNTDFPVTDRSGLNRPFVSGLAPEAGGGESSVLNQPKHSQDPFYLDSGGTPVDATLDLNRFGSIQLNDSDNEDQAGRAKRKRRQEAKKQEQAIGKAATFNQR
jgi:hypothetical protein